MATSASKKSAIPRGCKSTSRPSSAPVTRRWPSRVNTSNSTAVRRTLDDQKAKAVFRIRSGANGGVTFDMHHNQPKAPVKRKLKFANASELGLQREGKGNLNH